MAGPLFDMVKMSVTGTPGVDSVVPLGVAFPGFQTFEQAGAVDGDTVSYSITDLNHAWEVGSAVYSSTDLTLTRTPLFSSNENDKIVLTNLAKISSTLLAADVTGGTTTTYPREVDGDTDTLLAGDNGKGVVYTSADPVTVTVPSGLGAFQVWLVQSNDGLVTLTGDGASINNRQGHSSTAGPFAIISLVAIVEDVFVLGGDTSA